MQLVTSKLVNAMKAGTASIADEMLKANELAKSYGLIDPK